MTTPFFASAHRSRAEQFRQRYRVHDTLQGKLLSYITTTRAWIQITDLQVVAAIRPGLTPGTKLWFTVQSLYPDIVLEECTTSTPAIAQHIRQFMALRLQFETQSTNIAGPYWAKKLRPLLQAHPHLLQTYLKTLSSLRQINSGQSKETTFAYCPWALPTLSQSLLVFTPATPDTTLSQILGHGFLSENEPIWVEIKFDTHQNKVRYFAAKDSFPAQRLTHIPWNEIKQFPLHSPWDRILDPALTTLYRTTL